MKMVDSDAVFATIDGYKFGFGTSRLNQVHYDPLARLTLPSDTDPIIYGDRTTFSRVNVISTFSSRRVER